MGLALLVLAGAGLVAESAADSVALRDGTTILGQLVEPPGRGRLRMVVRRDWARAHVPERAAAWEKAEARGLERATRERQRRLGAWLRERPREPHDRIAAWLDAEIARLGRPGAAPPPLMLVELTAGNVRRVRRRPPEAARLMRQAWRAGLEGPEARPPEELRRLLEGRGFALGEVDPAPIDDLLPLAPEGESQWLIRRAATEVRDDRSLRYVHHLGLLLPEDGTGGIRDLATSLKVLVGEPGGREDAVARVSREVEARGRAGFLVTRLELGPGQDSATVEAALWVRQAPGRWVVAMRRPATVRVGELGPGAGEAIADDPRVRAAFRFLDGLGLGPAGEDAKRRSLEIGAATRRALGLARSVMDADLDGLALPVVSR